MKRLGIYIHIPFCVSKCNYCDFLSFRPRKVVEYVDSLICEIEKFDKKDYIVDTIFIGGGTPSILNIREIQRIVEVLYKTFDSDIKEFTIEANPESLDIEKLEAYINLGINRLSIGLQSTYNAMLKKLGRAHTYEEFINRYNEARKIGFDNINIDVMGALPNEKVSDYIKGLNEIVSLEPEHISSYGLIIEEGTKFYEMYNEEDGYLRHELNSDEDYINIYESTRKILSDRAYNRYEISNYAKKNKECMHNIKYWLRDDYAGFGLGASSMINNIRYKNVSDFNNYLKGEYLDQKEVLTSEDIFNEHVMLNLRTKFGMNIEEVYEKTGIRIDNKILDKFFGQNLLKLKDNILVLTEKGMEVSSYILSELMI